jgi:hypothetical protein
MPRIKDQDRADEGAPRTVNPNALGSPLRGDTTPSDVEGARAADAAPELPKQTASRRVKGAQFLGGVWLAADGTPLTPQEAQQAHRAMDKAAADARERVLRGEA